MLQDMANKRKTEEEELQRMVEQQQEKRKKFRDALLEKAMRARQQQQHDQQDNEETVDDNEEVPVVPLKKAKSKFAADQVNQQPAVVHTKPLPSNSSLLQPTTAYKLQSIQKATQEAISEEDALRLEEEKREYIASIRRKFKEQHKLILNQLAAKKKEEQEKVSFFEFLLLFYR